MHKNCVLNEEVLNKISTLEFDKLVSEPKLSETPKKFFDEPGLESILKEFGY